MNFEKLKITKLLACRKTHCSITLYFHRNYKANCRILRSEKLR